MTLHYALHLGGWFTLGGLLLGSHLWNAAWLVLGKKKPRA